MLVTEMAKPTPTSQSYRQLISSPTSVTNIDVAPKTFKSRTMSDRAVSGFLVQLGFWLYRIFINSYNGVQTAWSAAAENRLIWFVWLEPTISSHIECLISVSFFFRLTFLYLSSHSLLFWSVLFSILYFVREWFWSFGVILIQRPLLMN